VVIYTYINVYNVCIYICVSVTISNIISLLIVKFLISSPINIGEKPNHYYFCALSCFLIIYLSFSAIELDLGF
jgi:hypothetical protein